MCTESCCLFDVKSEVKGEWEVVDREEDPVLSERPRSGDREGSVRR